MMHMINAPLEFFSQHIIIVYVLGVSCGNLIYIYIYTMYIDQIRIISISMSSNIYHLLCWELSRFSLPVILRHTIN
jgi:hypothetical protein